MTNNKMQVYANGITNLTINHSGSFSAQEVVLLDEIRTFLFSLSDLFGQSLIEESGSAPALAQGLAASPIVPIPSQAPAAVMISSGASPVVDGCIAAQPQSIVQQAAQQRLNQLLAEQQKAKEAEIAQAALTQSLLQQIQQPVQVSAPVQEVVQQAIAPAPKAITLAEFVAMNKAKEEAPSVPAGQMSLEDFVKMNEAKAPSVQAQLDALLQQQAAVTPPPAHLE